MNLTALIKVTPVEIVSAKVILTRFLPIIRLRQNQIDDIQYFPGRIVNSAGIFSRNASDFMPYCSSSQLAQANSRSIDFVQADSQTAPAVPI